MRRCHFFNTPGGCRRGDQCTFSHQPPSAPSPATRQGPLPDAPVGICKFYWSTGNCRREFQCRLRHTLDPSLSPSSSSSTPGWRSSPPTPNPLAPFLTEAGLAKLNTYGTDVFFPPPAKPMSPNEIHNHLKKFLRDDFRFFKTFDVYSFLVALASIDTSGPHWAPEDGPLLLTSLATGNGLLRIGDVFSWPHVSTRAGSSPSVLSFQRAYIVLLKFYSSDFVVKSTLNHLVNGLYMRILDGHFDNWCQNLDACMQDIMEARSFIDPSYPASSSAALGGQVISSLAVVFYEILTRFKNASATYPSLVPIVRNLKTWTETWIEGVAMSSFDDPFKDSNSVTRHQITNHLRAKVDRLIAIVDREESRLDRVNERRVAASSTLLDRTHEGVVAALNITYDGPGQLRVHGPRHDNDFADIVEIRIVPTHEELISRIPPFLPGNFHDAPHHLPAESAERLLDLQFRLLREELTAPLRTSVQLVRDDLMNTSQHPTILSQVLKTNGGKYRGHTDGQDQVMFNVYTNITFASVTPDWRGLSVGLSIDAPPGRARHSQSRVRVAFWEGASGKRLIQGGLIALVWQTGTRVEVHLGIIASSLKELKESASQGANDRVSIRVVFSDPLVEVRILNILKNSDAVLSGTRVLVEASVMFESIRPFLEALRMEPESLPFAQYLVHRSRESLSSLNISPPRYAVVPNFTYQLASLFPPEAGVDDLKLDVSDPTSVASVRAQLRASRLDESQCEAVVDTLTREVAMIQGPPGTGKSYTGVEILRVLLANNVRPILMIAFTNHALDHMLTSVLDAGITKKVVRLGSRSADERISKYSMDTIEMVAGMSRLDRSFGHHFRDLKNVEEEIKQLMKTFVAANVTSAEFETYLQIQYGEHYEHLYQCPPSWIQTLREAFQDGEGSDWMRAGKHGKTEIVDDSMYAFWASGQDLDFLDSSLRQHAEYKQRSENWNRFSALETVGEVQEDADDSLESTEASSTGSDSDEEDEDGIEEEAWQQDWAVSDEEADSDTESKFDSTLPSTNTIPSPHEQQSPSSQAIQVADLNDPTAFFGGPIPSIPNSDRPLDTLLAEGTMWSLSRRERGRLDAYWSAQVRERRHEHQLQDFQSLRSKHEHILTEYQEGKNEIRRSLLSEIDIVGCTTTGAAKLTSLLHSLAPRVMLVEEAGQVLEAHILGSLVPSVEHLILIGDPLQLRPTLNNYSLSMDNPRGKQLFKFDMSLMERLASNGLAMSQINVQRRMRPAISSLIRNTLYPRLEDHDLVKSYDDVRGFSSNVFFFSHTHRENDGAEESSSKYNTFEVDMIKDLVLYLLRQGYSEEGDIVVLCAYLGQLARVRDALRDEVAVIIDGRDKDNLAEQEEDIEDRTDQFQIEQIEVTKRVRLRTIDNYQGEEAKIVILSTVRNAGSKDDFDAEHSYRRPTIGFLASENRTNVALSRAKEGLFILGNAAQLVSRSKMWREVIEQLESVECVGSAFPVSCHQHPNKVEMISKPGQLPLFAPDGGCLEPCNYRLKCGHVCHFKCHPDDPKHVTVSCPQPCRRLCAREHPCPRKCSDDCGKCQFPVRDVELPCGHTIPSIECHQLDNLDEFFCTVLVDRNFPTCEHSAAMMCSSDPSEAQCTQICARPMTCCGRDCNSKCGTCQGFNAPVLVGHIDRIQHHPHLCEKNLYCGHTCSLPCAQDHECATVCRKPCRQNCVHASCTAYCSTPCSPCMDSCTWACPHKKCPLPCGSVCARLPCDEPCPNYLRCGHQCPSVCGEDCEIQLCHHCAPEHRKKDVVDLILYRSFEDIEPTAGANLDDLLITLPKCGHVFTVETLDGIAGMGDFYTSVDGKWVGLCSPDTGGEMRAPPTCPTCREAITSPRYGRIFKSANIELLERNLISAVTRHLNKLHASMARISKSTIIDALKRETASLSIPTTPTSTKKQRQARGKARRKALNGTLDLPVALNALIPSEALHSVSPALSSVWRRVTRDLMDIYANAMKVAETRSAHAQAWEAAFSSLYEKEMDMAAADPKRAPRRPEEHAMRMARMKVGQLQPRADKRFLVEAFWATLEVRFILGDLTRIWMTDLLRKGKTFSAEDRQKFASFGLFVFDSCLRDAVQAHSIAKKSESRKQMTRSILFTMRAQLGRFGFNLEMVRASGKMREERTKLLVEAEREIGDAKGRIATTVKEHLARLPSDRQTWIPDNFSEIAQVVVSEWERMAQSIRDDTFYEPVSLHEQEAVVRALDFSHAGHFYKCPQGHVYVIGECGGAMQRSHCPECGEAIGGANHALDATNERALEFEAIAREAGTQRSPWEWNRF
ncbi:hypothetical protein C8R46DRAFT_1053533 [Mycena filopes]|nr:hypothetical protein C8R46DRAFT_1053533 [Mycena filopes]